MSDLVKRFKEDLQLSGYAERSIQSYISSVLRLQRFYNKPLELITEEELRQYWLCCQGEFGQYEFKGALPRCASVTAESVIFSKRQWSARISH